MALSYDYVTDVTRTNINPSVDFSSRHWLATTKH